MSCVGLFTTKKPDKYPASLLPKDEARNHIDRRIAALENGSSEDRNIAHNLSQLAEWF